MNAETQGRTKRTTRARADSRGAGVNSRGARRVALLAFASVSLGAFALAFAPGLVTTATPTRVVKVSAAFAQDARGFSHSTPQHASLACDSCHRRADNSPRPALPGHKSCIECHQPEFMSVDAQFCGGCHTDLAARNPPLKAFPALRSFSARFEHASHTQGAGRPEEGCASCHAPLRRGVALSIPAGAAAHENCYRCHTPQARGPAGRDISSCATCHALGGYSRTTTNSRAYSVSFSHAEHGPRRNLRCDDCHTVRAGAGQGRQVASPQPTQHFGSARARSCMTCHDNRRAFGGDDFADCKRCHKGPTFRF